MKRVAFILALIVSACASSQPAPISYGGGATPVTRAPPSTPTPPRAPRQAAQSAPAPEAPLPERGPAPAPDWAAAEGTPLSAYALQPGDAHPFDPARLPRTHRVRGGESLYDIAATYQVPLRALIDQNNLEPPYALAPDRELQLPPPRFHAVARGENFSDIARRYNVDTRSLALLNRMQPPYQVREGERVVLPAMARAYEPPAPAPVQSAASGAPAGAGRFAWPLRGEIVARFGPQSGGQRLDGIEIAGRAGEQIVAAAEGEVVYAGDDLPAYGHLVIVSHTEGYVTAYGYNRSALVREGDRVRAGQPVAELGEREGGRARLLFQVRRGGAPVDPAPLLGNG